MNANTHIKASNAVTTLASPKAKPNFMAELNLQALAHGLPKMITEYQFLANRRFRADGAYVDLWLLVEVEGGAFVEGRHTRGKGYTSDCEKYNLAQLAGYAVYRFTPSMVTSGRAIQVLTRAYWTAKARLEANGEQR